jgi:chitinase
MENHTEHNYQVIAYFPEWETRRPYYVKNMVTAGSAEKITIINYAFAVPAPDRESGDVVCKITDPYAAYGQVYDAEMSVDGTADDPNQPLRGHFNQLRKLKRMYPHIRVVVSFGGWTGCTWFSDAAASQAARERFVSSCIDVYIRGNLPELNGAGGNGAAEGVFDGIDIDWEYPIGGGLPDMHTRPDDDVNYLLLLEEFRRQYEAIGRPELLLTTAVPGPKQARQFKMEEAHHLLDLVSIMTYDFHGEWDRRTGHLTNLCTSKDDPDEMPISADMTMQLYQKELGVPAEKLMIGAGFYGRGWKNVPDANNGLYQSGDPLQREDFDTEGSTNYYALKERSSRGYARYWDDQAKTPYLFNHEKGIFISYDDPESVTLKARYVRHQGLAGVMFWEISADDAEGSMVDAIHRELSSDAPPDNPCG